MWTGMSLSYPFGWDQGILSWAGHVVVRGGMPYRDAWDMKGPVAYYVFALTEAIFGVNLWGVRVVDAAFLILTSACIGRAVSKLTDPATGRWSAILFYLWYASHSYWHTAQPDGWAGMLMAVVMLPALVQGDLIGPLKMGLAGACVGLMSLVKPTYAVFLVLPLLSSFSTRASRWVVDAAAVMGGWIVPIALCVGWFEAHGALRDLWAVYVRYPSTAYTELGALAFGERARGLVEYLFQAPVMAVGLPMVIVGALALWQTHRAPAHGAFARAQALRRSPSEDPLP